MRSRDLGKIMDERIKVTSLLAFKLPGFSPSHDRPTDNSRTAHHSRFEWDMGCGQRFGLIYVNYQTLKRTVKDSGRWYRDRIATQQRKEDDGEKLGTSDE